MYKYIEGFRYTSSRDVITFNDRFIRFGASNDIIRFNGKQFLQDVGSTISFQCPNLHLTKTLTTELSLTTKRLLGDEGVWSDRTGVHLIINHVVQFHHIDDTHGCFLVEAVSRFSIIEISMSGAR